MKHIENNKLIAEFMNRKYDSTPNYKGELIYDDYVNSPIIIKYHSSWSWIMPVVEKVYSLDLYYDKYIMENSSQFHNGKLELSVNINSVYKAVIEFIKWYNLQKEI